MFRCSQQTLLFGGIGHEGSTEPAADQSELELVPGYLEPQAADALFDALSSLPGWRQDNITLYGKTHPLPRLHRWFADSNEPYRWSGIAMIPEPFPGSVLAVRRQLERECGVVFNTALGNLYRSGKDSVSWHSDDEPELGPDPVIASLSLGATRRFLMRKKNDQRIVRTYELTHGSVLWMRGSTQAVWEHSIPKTSRTVGARINLTFRAIPAS